MIIPSKCPKCGDILLNDFGLFNNKSLYDVKICNKYPSHRFTIQYDSNIDKVLIMSYNDSSTKEIRWDFNTKTIYLNKPIIIKGKNAGVITTGIPYSKLFYNTVPWFDPDISNFDKLIRKIKIYATFL